MPSVRYPTLAFFMPDQFRTEQVLIGNQIVRLDYASCQFHGKIFTLPTYLEMLPTQAVSAFGSVLRTLRGSRETTTQALECFFRLPEMSRILDGLPIRIGKEMGQPNIQADSFARWFPFLNPLDIKAKLKVVPISSTNYANSFNLLQLIKVQVTGSPQFEASCLKPITESDSSSIFRTAFRHRFLYTLQNRCGFGRLKRGKPFSFPWLGLFSVWS
jgi:hypothetical protein